MPNRSCPVVDCRLFKHSYLKLSLFTPLFPFPPLPLLHLRCEIRSALDLRLSCFS